MLKVSRAPFSRSAAIFAAVAFLIVAGALGATHDFGAFLISLVALPLLFLAGAVTTIIEACWRRSRRNALIALALMVAAVPVYLGAYDVAQRIRFLAWAPAHSRMLAQATQRDGVIMGWDSWGFAGGDTDSYLVSDTQDRLGSKARYDQWAKAVGQSCGAWRTQKMWPKLYVVTTYTNCPFEGVEPAG